MIPIFLQLLDNDDDREFLIRLYEDYFFLMRKHALALLQDDALAQEMIDDAFIKFIENISTIRSLECHVLPAYIVSTIRNLSLNHLRREKRISAKEVYGLQEEWMEGMQDTNTNTEEEVLLRLDIEHMKRAIQRLPENYRDVLSLKYTLHMSDADIAKMLGIKKDSVRQYLGRARKKALSLLQNEEEQDGKQI